MIVRDDPTGHEQVEQLAERGDMLLDGRCRSHLRLPLDPSDTISAGETPRYLPGAMSPIHGPLFT
jgi:hypothetical protein